jgi:NADH-quinone oxidoreductase subunit M
MIEFAFPWLSVAVLAPVVAAALMLRQRLPERARQISLVASTVSLLSTSAAWLEMLARGASSAADRWDIGNLLGRAPLLSIDALSAPLLPVVSLVCVLIYLATLRRKLQRFAAAGQLLAEGVMLATFACRQPWLIVGLLAVGTIPAWVELRLNQKPLRIFTLHMAAFVVLLVIGQTLLARHPYSTLGCVLLTAAVLVRIGVAPVHLWFADLFEHASFGTALLFVTPMVDAYATMRLVLPIAPEWVLRAVTLLSVLTAIYAAGMALVQVKARRMFSYLFLSHSSLVFVGLETATKIGLTGALCAWVAITLSMTGFGITLRSIEARMGRIRLDSFLGLYEHIPRLAVLFLITGLAAIGFPGTAGFVGGELLVESAVQIYPLMGVVVVVVAAFNGIAVLRAYFRIFTGARRPVTVDLRLRPPERMAVLALIFLMIGGGLYPQPAVMQLYEGASNLVNQRARYFGEPTPTPEPHHHGANSPAKSSRRGEHTPQTAHNVAVTTP